MNYLDLFHGIGGFALGAYWAGMKFENHYCSDIEPYTQELYKLRFPDSIQLGDITKIKAEDLPDGEWIITGGFPCQDISIAGKGAGIHGTRSGLWFEYWRLIRDLRPRFAIMENVSALSFSGLGNVLGSLHEIGYNAEWQNIPAKRIGACHERNRIFIVAHPDCFRFTQPTGKRPEQYINLSNKNFWERTGSEWFIERNRQGKQKYNYKSMLCGVDDGISKIVDRLKGLGNAIVPQIAELLFKRIKYLLESEPRKASQS